MLTTPVEEQAHGERRYFLQAVGGIDLHVHRSVICLIDEQGRQVDCVRVDNDPTALVAEVLKAGRAAPVAIEATYGWYWAVDALLAAKCEVHLAHPYGMKAMRKRKRVKTGAHELANRLRLGSLPEAYIALPSSGSCGSWSGTAGSWSTARRRSRTASAPCWPSTVCA